MSAVYKWQTHFPNCLYQHWWKLQQAVASFKTPENSFLRGNTADSGTCCLVKNRGGLPNYNAYIYTRDENKKWNWNVMCQAFTCHPVDSGFYSSSLSEQWNALWFILQAFAIQFFIHTLLLVFEMFVQKCSVYFFAKQAHSGKQSFLVRWDDCDVKRRFNS